jgi:ubiquinone/menaquinone biosynthesis C-methylase UbiE
MIKRAIENATKGNYQNVQFSHAAIEDLPLGDNGVDVAISNCVLNHCTDKVAAFKEVFRVLRPGGRLCIADLLIFAKHSDRKRIRTIRCV